MSHQVQLGPAASHCPTAVLNPAGHATKPPACRSRCPATPRPYMRRIVFRLGNPIRTAIFHTRQRFPGESGTGTAEPVRAVLPRSRHCPLAGPTPAKKKRREDTAGNLCTLHYVPSHPGSDLPASKAHDRDRPVRYPGATGHRPLVVPRRHRAQASPNDHADASDSAAYGARRAEPDPVGGTRDIRPRHRWAPGVPATTSTSVALCQGGGRPGPSRWMASRCVTGRSERTLAEPLWAAEWSVTVSPR